MEKEGKCHIFEFGEITCPCEFWDKVKNKCYFDIVSENLRKDLYEYHKN